MIADIGQVVSAKPLPDDHQCSPRSQDRADSIFRLRLLPRGHLTIRHLRQIRAWLRFAATRAFMNYQIGWIRRSDGSAQDCASGSRRPPTDFLSDRCHWLGQSLSTPVREYLRVSSRKSPGIANHPNPVGFQPQFTILLAPKRRRRVITDQVLSDAIRLSGQSLLSPIVIQSEEWILLAHPDIRQGHWQVRVNEGATAGALQRRFRLGIGMFDRPARAGDTGPQRHVVQSHSQVFV